MRRLYVLGYTLVILCAIASFIGVKLLDASGVSMTQSNSAFKLTSPAFTNNATIPVRYTCQGDNTNPPLDIEGTPTRAESLALIMHDPDAPSGDFTHWLIWNIDTSIRQIDENSLPGGTTQGTTSFGQTQYGGPCPPSGTHHYVFDLYALDTNLNLPSSSSQADLRQTMQGHILDQATLTGLFSK